MVEFLILCVAAGLAIATMVLIASTFERDD